MKTNFAMNLAALMALLVSIECFGVGDKGDAELWDEFQEWDGEELSKTYCVTCHLYPETELLPKESWPYLLDLMGLYFGYDEGRLLSSSPDDETRASLFDVDKYPKKPTLSPFQWAAIRDYYESSKGSGSIAPPPEGERLIGFKESLIYGDEETPVISLVKIRGDGLGFYLSDANNNRLARYDSSGRLVNSDTFPGSIVQLNLEGSMQRITVIGEMHPTNAATGSLFERPNDSVEWREVLSGLHRPVSSLAFDFDGDETDEILLNEFGHYKGSLSLVERAGGQSMARHVMRSEPGSISSEIFFHGEGSNHAHAIVLNAQARQDISLYRYAGDLQFEREALLEKPPAFGYTQLRLIDLTGDGIDELVTINGDNADLPGPPLKAYHGVRIYRIDQGPSLEEISFLPVPGAFQATFGDFDENGYIDIAVVSFFPDSRRLDQGFVYFENKGDLDFVRRSMGIGSRAPWMTIDSGDVDGDGDLDIVLGSGYVSGRPSGLDTKRLPAAAVLSNNRIIQE